MDVKVGQVWKSKYGSYYKILDVKDKTVVVEIDGEDITVIFKKYLTDAKLVSESDPSDLEILQRALEYQGAHMFVDEDGELCCEDVLGNVLVDGDTVQVLTWAKQTINGV